MDSICDGGKYHLEKILDVIYKKYVQTCEWKNLSARNYHSLSLIFQPWAMDNRQNEQEYSIEESSKICTCNETESSTLENELEKKLVDDIDKIINKAKLVRISKDKKGVSEKSLVNKTEQTSKVSQNDFSSESNNSCMSQMFKMNECEADSAKINNFKLKSTKSIVKISNSLGKSTYKKDFSLRNTRNVNDPKVVKNLNMYKKPPSKKSIYQDKNKHYASTSSTMNSEKTKITDFHNKVPTESNSQYSYVSNTHLPSCPLLESGFQTDMKVSSTTTEYTNLEEALDILGIPSDLVKCLNLYYNYLIDLNRKKSVDVKSSFNKNKFLEKLKHMNASKWNNQDENKIIENVKKQCAEYSAKINCKKINYKEVIIYQSYGNVPELQMRHRQCNIAEKIQIYQSIINVINNELFDLNLKLNKETYTYFYQLFKHIQSFFNKYQTNTAAVLDT